MAPKKKVPKGAHPIIPPVNPDDPTGKKGRLAVGEELYQRGLARAVRQNERDEKMKPLAKKRKEDEDKRIARKKMK